MEMFLRRKERPARMSLAHLSVSSSVLMAMRQVPLPSLAMCSHMAVDVVFPIPRMNMRSGACGAALATAFFYAGFLVVAKGLRERYPAMQIMAILSVWCGGACFAVAILRGERLVPQTIHGWLLLVGLEKSG